MGEQASSSLPSATLNNVSLLLLASVAQKLVVFVLNQFILAKCNPELFGRIAIQMELWLSMSLFLSRESVRIACLRYSTSSSEGGAQA
ncbi:hypothetical protein EON64_20855, partial [archaeon]